MDSKTIVTKTAKGLREASGKTSDLSRDLRKLLKEIDGKSSLGDLLRKLGDWSEDELQQGLETLVSTEYAREVIVEGPASASAPPLPHTAARRAPPPAAPAVGEDLDFTALVPEPDAKAEEQGRQQAADQARREAEERAKREALEHAKREAAERARREAEAKAKRDAEEKATREAEERARQQAAAEAARRQAEEQARREAEERARREAAERARRDAEAAARRQAEEQARREAEAKAGREAEEAAAREAAERARQQAAAEAAKHQAEEQARREAEERVRREAAEKAAREAEAARRQAEEQARREAAEKAQREAEEKARRDAEELARREAEETAKREALERAMRRAEEKARHEAEEKARHEAEEKARHEAEEKARHEAEEQARREAAERARREAEEVARREAEAKAKREAEEQARQEAEEVARREAETKAKREEAEEKARREAEEVARREAEAKAKREAEERARREAEEVARRDAEERARREAEESARREAEDKARREAEDKARRETEDKARRETEEKAERDAEELARLEAAELTHEADEKARRAADAHARRAAEEDAERDAEDLARQRAVEARRRAEEEEVAREAEEAAVTSAKVPPGPRKAGKWGRAVALGLVSLLVVGLGAIHVIPFDGRIPELERVAAAHFGQPVKIRSLRASLFPPQLKLEGIAIGADGQIRAPQVRAMTGLGGVLGGTTRFEALQVDSPVFSEEGLGWLLFGRSPAPAIQLARVSAANARIEAGSMTLPPFNATVTVGDDGNWRKIAVESADKKVAAELQAAGDAVQVALTAAQSSLPFGAATVFDDIAASGTANRGGLAITEFKARLHGGTLAGKARLKLGAGGGLEGELIASTIDAAQMFPGLMASGRLDGKGIFVLPAGGKGGAKLDGDFVVDKGTLAGTDLGRMLQSGAGGGQTQFSRLTGSLAHHAGRSTLRQLRLDAGKLSATGTAEVDEQGNAYGQLIVELSLGAERRRAVVALSGPYKSLAWSRH
jgi:hypothetical protein